MAVSLIALEVSDLCIGKPPAASVPLSATVAAALAALRTSAHRYAAVWKLPDPSRVVGNVCAVDVLCLLCSAAEDPSAALQSPVGTLVRPESAARIRTVDLHLSILEALNLIVDGVQNLLVPIRSHSRKRVQADTPQFCCLTQEDFVRFFLNYIGLFSPIPALSVESLGIVRSEVLSIGYHDPAISAIHLIKKAAESQTAVAVVEDGKLVGEISPTTLALCCGGDESVAAAITVLSVGELMAYIDCGGPPEDAVNVVKARLREKGLKGMLELMEKDENEGSSIFSSSSSSSSCSATSSSSSEDESPPSTITKRRAATASRRRFTRSSSYSARMSRRSEEAIVCHPGSSLMATMMQALAHRVSYVWVVKDDYELAGIVTFPDVLRIFRDQLLQLMGCSLSN